MRIAPHIPAALVLTLCQTLALEVRVESPNGAPRIVVDGQPVRARMFYGGPGWTAIRIGAEWRPVEFEFVATGGADHGTMHFRFGSSVGEVWLDDLNVTDLTTNKDLIPTCGFEGGQSAFDQDWTHWPADMSNTVGTIRLDPKSGYRETTGLHVTLVDPPDGRWPDFHIYHHPNLNIQSGHRYHVKLRARSTPSRSLNIEFHRPGNPFVRIGGPPDPFPSQIKLAANAGVNFVSFPVELPWPEPGEPANWESVDGLIRSVLSANPRALLIPRVPMNPPPWWKAGHPDEVMQWEDGRRDSMVVASPVYRKHACERLEAFIEHVESEFGDHVAGYHPTGQNTGEWFYENAWETPLNGYAPADLKAWRLWLGKRYADDSSLRAAWHAPQASLEQAMVPTAEARHASPAGVFRDSLTEQAVIDWGDFQQDAMADCVRELAHAARTASKERKLVLFFYGYVHELAGLFTGPYTSGHYRLRRILDSQDIDILCAPIAYFDRGMGGSSPSMTAAESVSLAGKLWLNEDDTHTYLATGTPPGYREHVNTLEETNAELTRNVAQASLRNFATWWMDLTQTGWFNDPAMWAEMKKLKTLDDSMLQSPAPFHPEIASIVDEAAMARVGTGSPEVIRACVYESRRKLARVGAPYGQYLLDDLLAGRVKAKLFVMLNVWQLTQAQREKLQEVTKDGVCVWCYAPGWFAGATGTLTSMESLTGFELSPQEKTQAWATPTGNGLTQAFGLHQMPRPLFSCADARPDEALATYPDGRTAVAVRGHSIFVGAPGLTTELLRHAALKAGAHLFTSTDCNVVANAGFLALHGSQTGPLSIDTGKNAPVIDLLTGRQVGKGPNFTLHLKLGETRILRIAP